MIRNKAEAGMTLIELMIAMAIMAVMLTGLGATSLKMDRANMLAHDRAVAHKAIQQMIEMYDNADASDWIACVGKPIYFTVPNMQTTTRTSSETTWSTTKTTNTIGTMTITDLKWGNQPGYSYQWLLDVSISDSTDTKKNITYARVYTGRRTNEY